MQICVLREVELRDLVLPALQFYELGELHEIQLQEFVVRTVQLLERGECRKIQGCERVTTDIQLGELRIVGKCDSGDVVARLFCFELGERPVNLYRSSFALHGDGVVGIGERVLVSLGRSLGL